MDNVAYVYTIVSYDVFFRARRAVSRNFVRCGDFIFHDLIVDDVLCEIAAYYRIAFAEIEKLYVMLGELCGNKIKACIAVFDKGLYYGVEGYSYVERVYGLAEHIALCGEAVAVGGLECFKLISEADIHAKLRKNVSSVKIFGKCNTFVYYVFHGDIFVVSIAEKVIF